MHMNIQQIGTQHIYVLVAAFFLSSCGVSKKSLENISARMSNQSSQILIQSELSASTTDLARLVENMLSDTLAEGMYEDYDLDYIVQRSGDMTISATGRTLTSSMPMTVAMQGDLGIANVSAEGELEVSLVSDIRIDPDWTLRSSTRLASHEWIEKPRVKMGFINIGAERIADYLIKRMEADLISQLDTALSENLNLPQEIRSMQDRMISELAYKVGDQWVNIIPSVIAISDLQESDDNLGLQIGLTSDLRVADTSIAYAEVDTARYMYRKWDEDITTGQIVLSLHERDLQNLMGAYLDSNRIDLGGSKQILLTDTKLQAQSGSLLIAMRSSGYLNGDLVISARPEYNENRNEIMLSDFVIKSKVKGIIKRAGLSLAKGKIKSKVEEGLNEVLWSYLDSYNTMISEWSRDQQQGDVPVLWDARALKLSPSAINVSDELIQALLVSESTIDLRIRE